MNIILKNQWDLNFEVGDIIISNAKNHFLLIVYSEYGKDGVNQFSVFNLDSGKISDYRTYDDFEEDYPILRVLHSSEYDIYEKGVINND